MCFGQLSTDMTRGGDPSEHWHLEVHQDDAGLMSASQCQGYSSVGGLIHHIDVRVGFQNRCQAPTNDLLVVHQEDSNDTHATLRSRPTRISVPPLGLLSVSTVAPIIFAVSHTPNRP